MKNKCHICNKEKPKPKNKYCSYKCRNIYINSIKDYSKQSKKISESLTRLLIDTKGELLDFKVKCNRCNKDLIVNERSKEFPKKEKYFCSRSCANSRGKRSEVFKNKVRTKLKKIEIEKLCKCCNNIFKTKNENQIFCSVNCSGKYRRLKSIENKSIKDLYRKASLFRFSLNDYPNEFDFKLIESYGWYKAKNHGDNPNGISRDHLISRMHGYNNMINPLILAHPANCGLKQHNINISKNINCDLTLNELLKKIEHWNIKYNENFKVDKIFINEDDLRQLIIDL